MGRREEKKGTGYDVCVWPTLLVLEPFLDAITPRPSVRPFRVIFERRITLGKGEKLVNDIISNITMTDDEKVASYGSRGPCLTIEVFALTVSAIYERSILIANRHFITLSLTHPSPCLSLYLHLSICLCLYVVVCLSICVFASQSVFTV